MPRATKRRHPRADTRRQLRLAALRSWEQGDNLEDVAVRLRVRVSWLWLAIRDDVATVQRHFGPGETADSVVELAAGDLHLVRDSIAPRTAQNFAGYCIRRLYARQQDASARHRMKDARKRDAELDRKKPEPRSLANLHRDQSNVGLKAVGAGMGKPG